MAAWLVGFTIGLPWLGAVCIWLFGDRHPALRSGLAVGFSLAAGVAALALLPFATEAVVIRLPFGSLFGDLTFVPDGLGVPLAIIATVVGSLTVIFSLDYMRDESQLGRYYALILYFIGAMAALVLTGSLLFLFLFWEVTAFCSYALISFHNDDPKAVRGGIKALIMTQVGGIGLLAGALLAYTYTGDFQISNFLAQASAIPASVLTAIAFGYLLAAAAKSAQLPFHTWLPDAMEAPTPVSALIHAATMVNAGVYLLVRFAPAFSPVPLWNTAVVTVGLLSALYAATMAALANDLKRMLAYSTISQLGFMVYAVGIGDLFAGQFHLLNHALFKALLFLGAGAIIHTLGTREMRAMGGLGKRMPFVRTMFMVGALALVGLPPLNGFWSKELILEAGFEQGPRWAYWGMLASVGLTALYSARAVRMVFFGQPNGQVAAHDATPAMRTSLAVLAVAVATAWLLAPFVAEALAATLPHHPFHPISLLAMIAAIFAAGSTWWALAIIGVGAAIGWWQERLSGVWRETPWLTWAITNELGFESINRGIADATQRAAEAVRMSQTGQLSWNVVGIVVGLLVVLFVLAMGA